MIEILIQESNKNTSKFDPLIQALQDYGCNMSPLIIITIEYYHGGIHSHNLVKLPGALSITLAKVKTWLTSFHLTAIKSLSALILNKSKLKTCLGYPSREVTLEGLFEYIEWNPSLKMGSTPLLGEEVLFHASYNWGHSHSLSVTNFWTQSKAMLHILLIMS